MKASFMVPNFTEVYKDAKTRAALLQRRNGCEHGQIDVLYDGNKV